MINYFKKTRGSIALISTLIVSMFVLILAVAMAENSISVGYQHVNNAASNFSMNFAEGCFEEALHRIELDTNYAGSTLDFADGNCAITVSGGGTKTIDIILTYLDYVQHFRGTAAITVSGHANNASLSTWDEI